MPRSASLCKVVPCSRASKNAVLCARTLEVCAVQANYKCDTINGFVRKPTKSKSDVLHAYNCLISLDKDEDFGELQALVSAWHGSCNVLEAGHWSGRREPKQRRPTGTKADTSRGNASLVLNFLFSLEY
jgi:hypothetical protein